MAYLCYAMRKGYALSKLEALCRELSDMELLKNAPMRKLTTFGVGGPADALLYPRSEEEIRRAVEACKAMDVPFYVMGNGSNLLVRDGGIRGLVLVIGGNFSSVRVTGEEIDAQAGVTLTALAGEALQNGLMGLEWACGIPGTLGGACAMNAGAYGGSMDQVLRSVRLLKQDGEILDHVVQTGDLGYRESAFCAPQAIVLAARLKLCRDDGGARERQNCYLQQRREKQPLSEKSAGSTFKRPPGHFAGALIEGAGLKGARVGGAAVSQKHAGFVINTGGATARDILQLIALVQARVQEAYGVALHMEVKVLGEEG